MILNLFGDGFCGLGLGGLGLHSLRGDLSVRDFRSGDIPHTMRNPSQ
jgi:hypothetical protein